MHTTDLDQAMQSAVEAGQASSIAWYLACDGEARAGAVGHVDADPDRPAGPDTIFRISSMSKPITAVAALQLVDDGLLALDGPVDDLLPELAHRRVLADPHGPIDDTVAAERSITLRDLLTFRMGLGFDFAGPGVQPSLDRLGELGLPPGPPRPQEVPPPDDWLALIGSVPLEFQPGARWLYHLSADVLGVLIERATGRTLGDQLARRVFGPLGMADSGFTVPDAKRDRFGACYGEVSATGTRDVFDLADGQWAAPPPFRSGGAGLVSTADDFGAFASMLLRGGAAPGGERLLSASLLDQMTTNQLTEDQVATGGPAPGDAGWGFGVGVQLRTVPIRAAGAYDWDGGLGSSWANDPQHGLIGILLTDQMWTSPTPPPVCTAFWTEVYRTLL
ncbi:MAG: CubicO group peptidase beta-lactamase class family [Ilumatobacteraceae bacterium]|nr:CubicO group peptidase beta-lactamase class family [Ilumatobacteraceae bacterium]